LYPIADIEAANQLGSRPIYCGFPPVSDRLKLVDNTVLYGKMTEIFHDVFDDDDIVLSPQLTANDVDGWDSLKHVRLILSIEKGFGVKFAASEVGHLNNVGDLANLIAAKVS
jgi:acyl carrier protein